jgi:hypothetical protein
MEGSNLSLPDVRQRARDVYISDLGNPEKFIDFGSPLLNEAFLGLDSGVFLVAGPPNFGKCLAKGTKVSLNGGKAKAIDGMRRSSDVVTVNTAAMCLTTKMASPVVCSGKHKCWKLRTILGDEITATKDHPFLTLRGWVPLIELRSDDRIAVVDEGFITWRLMEGRSYVGVCDTYDIEVPDTHNFIANGFVVHNSTVVRCLYQQVIVNSPDRVVLDLSLDDDFSERVRFAVASMAKIPINWVKLPHGIPDEAKEARNLGYKAWNDSIAPRLTIIDETDFDGAANKLSTIRAAIEIWTSNLPSSAKPLIVIDGFHNIEVDDAFGMKDLEKQVYLSSALKHIAAMTKSIILATCHIPKQRARRGLDHTAVKGAGNTGYDAKVIANIYSDYKANRNNASVYFDAYLQHEPELRKRQPVIELDVRKNKAGDFSDVIFFRHYPEYSYVEEAPDNFQKLWRQTIYGGD